MPCQLCLASPGADLPAADKMNLFNRRDAEAQSPTSQGTFFSASRRLRGEFPSPINHSDKTGVAVKDGHAASTTPRIPRRDLPG